MIRSLTSRAVSAAVERDSRLQRFVAELADRSRLQASLLRAVRLTGRVDTVYDIGAYRGGWTESMRRVFPNAEFLLFEANPAHADDLACTGERYFIETLSSEEQLVDFYATGEPGDSYYRELTPNYSDVTPRRVRTTMLDALVERNGLPLPDLIKADVQGAELDVLTGGAGALSHAKLVLLECALDEYNAGAPSFGDYLEFMQSRGFTPFEFMDPKWLDAKMMQVDVLFVTTRTTRRRRRDSLQ
jgi:FkbM family methyltransferase